jgi:heme/copper-type cytochrome/quinol oxidase subunit 2
MNVIFLSMLTPGEMQWLDFSVFFGAFVLVAIATLVWYFRFRNKKSRRRKHRHHRRQIKPTLAQTSGLPPVRHPENPPGKIMPPPQ